LLPAKEIFPQLVQLFVNMIHHRPNVKTPIYLLSLLFLLLINSQVKSQDAGAGRTLFLNNCASCHAVKKELTGPALAGVDTRITDRKLLHAWIRNNQKVIQSGEPYFVELFNRYGKKPMNTFPTITDAEIENILAYIKQEESKVTGPVIGETVEKASDNSLVFGIITLIMAIIALILLQVNSSLRKLADDREGIPSSEPLPFYRNKTYITLITMLLFIVGGYFVIQGAVNLGRNKNYQPVQPIYYSHKVHAGVNQVNCLYCHGGAWDSKHASIPSVNVCMNCHKAISTYEKGPKLHDVDGKEINGTGEIEKLYSYAGFKSGQEWDPSKAKPIEWVRVHNLPDHVYFNHSQHVRVGNVQCQTCHGEVTSMDVAKQYAELSMGWCINCHRTSKVNFDVDEHGNPNQKGNKFYSLYEKFHNDIKAGRMDSVTVEAIGGLECQKCHY
jgi:mono/diheme cytochrome c family protein